MDTYAEWCAPHRLSFGMHCLPLHGQHHKQQLLGNGQVVCYQAAGNMHRVQHKAVSVLSSGLHSTVLTHPLSPCLLKCRYGGEHKAPELQKEAVYGLTELHREAVK